jgi:hypothetical protein
VILGVLINCLEPVDITSIGSENALVVDALITDNVSKQRVTLSRTVTLDQSNTHNPEVGATVSLSDNEGNQINFTEISPGTYETVNDFGAELGKTYQLAINTQNGQSYLSDPSTMIPNPGFDSLYTEFEPYPSNFNRFGGFFNFYIDMHNNPDNHQYFKWSWNSTYEARVATPSRWLWTGGDTFVIRELGSENDSLQVERCWSTDTSKIVNIKNLLDGETQVIRQPIHRFHSDSGYMRIRYSLLVKQYAISEESYRYWNLIKESGSQGFLFDKQIGSITGNIYNTKSDEPVLGYFEVAQEYAVRKFYTHADFTREGFFNYTSFIIDCSDEEPIIMRVEELETFMEQFQTNYTIAYFITGGGVAFRRIICADCTLHAQTNQKPEFW